jgi:hypothetical protein
VSAFTSTYYACFRSNSSFLTSLRGWECMSKGCSSRNSGAMIETCLDCTWTPTFGSYDACCECRHMLKDYIEPEVSKDPTSRAGHSLNHPVIQTRLMIHPLQRRSLLDEACHALKEARHIVMAGNIISEGLYYLGLVRCCQRMTALIIVVP